MRLLALAVCLATFAAPQAARAAATVKVDYRITLAGLTLGQADLAGTFDGERYSLTMGAQLTGLAGVFTGGSRGGATTTGTRGANRLVSTGFSATGQTSSAERTVQVGLSGGAVTAVVITPPLEGRPERVPLSDADRRNVTDPVSGMLAVLAKPGAPDSSACDRTVPVFDGTQRFNVVLSYAETRTVQKPGFSGPVLVCDVRYVPIAGHRLDRPSVQYMAANRDMSVWLAPVEGTRVLVPLRVSVKTEYGTTIIEAERWSVGR